VQEAVGTIANNLLGRAAIEDRQLRQVVEQSFDRGFLVGGAPTRRGRPKASAKLFVFSVSYDFFEQLLARKRKHHYSVLSR